MRARRSLWGALVGSGRSVGLSERKERDYYSTIRRTSSLHTISKRSTRLFRSHFETSTLLSLQVLRRADFIRGMQFVELSGSGSVGENALSLLEFCSP